MREKEGGGSEGRETVGGRDSQTLKSYSVVACSAWRQPGPPCCERRGGVERWGGCEVAVVSTGGEVKQVFTLLWLSPFSPLHSS